MNRKLISVILTLALATLAGTSILLAQTKPLQRVEAKKVCMINEQVFEKDQIPVEVDGKTYYGCCEMCKAKLASYDETRVAVDPVSGKKVDKADAVIAADEDGSVFYFENEKNLATFNVKRTMK